MSTLSTIHACTCAKNEDVFQASEFNSDLSHLTVEFIFVVQIKVYLQFELN